MPEVVVVVLIIQVALAELVEAEPEQLDMELQTQIVEFLIQAAAAVVDIHQAYLVDQAAQV